MRIIRPPRDVIGDALLALWRGTPELYARFPETEEGVASFCAFMHDAVRRRIATAEGLSERKPGH